MNEPDARNSADDFEAPRQLSLTNSTVGPVERRYVESALSAEWSPMTTAQVSEFERRLEKRIDRDTVIATANGTLAVELALRALGIGVGDEVVVPALTCAAPVTSVLAVGALPVLADISPVSWTLAPEDVKRRLTPHTRAILAVNLLGHPCDYDELMAFGIPVIEDAAQSLGAQYKGRTTGSLGTISVLSFHAGKTITTGEGGCVATDSAELADRMRVIVNGGERPERPYIYELVGRNFGMSNLAAAVGLGQLDRWDELVGGRNSVCERYCESISAAECTHRPVAEWATHSCWQHTIVVRNRTKVLPFIRERLATVVSLWPALSSSSLFSSAAGRFPVAQEIASKGICLPTWAGMGQDDMQFVSAAVEYGIAKARVEPQW